MSERYSIGAWEADFRANKTARYLINALDTFNLEHPDPDAEKVAQNFDYLTDNYLIQMCGSVLSRFCTVVPPEEQGNSISSEAGAVVTFLPDDQDEFTDNKEIETS